MSSKSVTPLLVLVVAVLAVALFVRGGEVLSALAILNENSTAVTVEITGSEPHCSAPVCYDADDTTDFIDLVGGGERYVHCNTTCNDANNWGNIKNYTSDISNAATGCTAGNVGCYPNATCMNYSVVNTTAQYVNCQFFFRYNAGNTSKSGDWTFTMNAGDVGGLKSTAVTDTIDVSELLAIGVDATLTFSGKTAGANDSTTATLDNVYNYGNIEIDFKVNSTAAMTCTGAGTIAAEYLKMNLTNGGSYLSGWPMSSTLGGPDATTKFNANLAANATATTQFPQASIKQTYWGIGIPPATGGSCTGYIWFAAVNS
jgi:hypothetical protein